MKRKISISNGDEVVCVDADCNYKIEKLNTSVLLQFKKNGKVIEEIKFKADRLTTDELKEIILESEAVDITVNEYETQKRRLKLLPFITYNKEVKVEKIYNTHEHLDIITEVWLMDENFYNVGKKFDEVLTELRNKLSGL